MDHTVQTHSINNKSVCDRRLASPEAHAAASPVYTILWCIQSCGVYNPVVYTNPDLSEAAADLIQTLERPCV